MLGTLVAPVNDHRVDDHRPKGGGLGLRAHRPDTDRCGGIQSAYQHMHMVSIYRSSIHGHLVLRADPARQL